MKRSLISLALLTILGTSVHAASVPWRLFYGIREGFKAGHVPPPIGVPAAPVVDEVDRAPVPSALTPVRVLLFEGRGPIHVGVPQGGRLQAGTSHTAVPVLSVLRIESRGSAMVVAGPGRHRMKTSLPLRVEPAGQKVTAERTGDQIFSLEGRLYRGTLTLTCGPSGTVEAVDDVPLEQYLYGVVPRELNADTLEAVKAQAVVSRTYALSHLQPTRPYDVVSDVRAQAYGGLAVESVKTRTAIDQTEGQVLSYHGRLAGDVCYHASCGGQTAANEDVFGTRPVPYLRSVADTPTAGESPAGMTEGGAYCSCSPYYHWTVRWSSRALGDVLRDRLKLPASVGRLAGVTPLASTPDGRLQRVEVRFEKASRMLSGEAIRHAFACRDHGRVHDLYSTWCTISRDDRTDVYTADGHGWGHGVGMCQWGAIGMARDGHTYDEILAHYFPGTDLTELRPGHLVGRGTLAGH